MKYLQDILQQFKSKRLAMINNNHEDYQYNSGDLVYIISPLTSQLRTNSRKVTIKICRTISYLQNSGSSQLSIDDIRWKNFTRSI